MRKRGFDALPFKRRSPLKKFIFFGFSLAVILTVFTLYRIDKALLPIVIEKTNLHTKTKVNAAINDSLTEVIAKYNVKSEDFYIKNENGGKINSLSVNTILVNQICSELAVSVSENLKYVDKEQIDIPLGAVFGLSAFWNLGPKYSVSLTPLGNSQIDYLSSFKSTGINQINFQIWLNVETTIKVFSPLKADTIILTRKVSLVNTVFSGEIPETYIDLNNSGS